MCRYLVCLSSSIKVPVLPFPRAFHPPVHACLPVAFTSFATCRPPAVPVLVCGPLQPLLHVAVRGPCKSLRSALRPLHVGSDAGLPCGGDGPLSSVGLASLDFSRAVSFTLPRVCYPPEYTAVRLPLSLSPSLPLFSLLSSRSPSRPSLSLCRSRAALFLPVGLSANISARSAFPSFRPFRLQPSFRPQSYFVYLRPAVPSVPDLSVPCLPRVCIAPLRPIVWRPCFGVCGSGGGRVSARARREPSCRCPKVGSGGRWRCCLWRT